MPNWTLWDWVGRIGTYTACYAILAFGGWYGALFLVGVIMVLFALIKGVKS